MYSRQAATALLVLALAAPLPGPAAGQINNSTPLSSIFGCDAPGRKQVGGAVLGGIIGGIIGNNVAKNERGLGTAAGVALGAAAGSYVGCRMQRSDQQKAELAARDALERDVDTRWTNPETGASGEVRVVSTQPYRVEPEPEPATLEGITLSAGVEIAEAYAPDGGRYRARNTVRLRVGPDSAAPVTSSLRPGDQIEGLARVRGSDWLLVGRDRVGMGYAPASAMRPVERAAGPVCRTFDQTFRSRGGEPETQRYTACRDPDGEWVIQS